MNTDIRKVTIHTDQGEFNLGLVGIILEPGETLVVKFLQDDGDIWTISGHVDRGFKHWLRRKLKI